MPLGDDFMGVTAFGGVHRVEREVVDDEEVRGEQLAQLCLVGVVEQRVLELLGKRPAKTVFPPSEASV